MRAGDPNPVPDTAPKRAIAPHSILASRSTKSQVRSNRHLTSTTTWGACMTHCQSQDRSRRHAGRRSVFHRHARRRLPAADRPAHPLCRRVGAREAHPGQPRQRHVHQGCGRHCCSQGPPACADSRASARPKARLRRGRHAWQPRLQLPHPQPAYPFDYSPQNGTFGDGQFCGQVPRLKTGNGARRRVRSNGTLRDCRVPNSVAARVTLSYTTAS
jgi:hypothetical protein